jgi:hypothetical protein
MVYGKWKNVMDILRYFRSLFLVISALIIAMLFIPDIAHPRQNFFTNGEGCGYISTGAYVTPDRGTAIQIKQETSGNGIPTGKEV